MPNKHALPTRRSVLVEKNDLRSINTPSPHPGSAHTLPVTMEQAPESVKNTESTQEGETPPIRAPRKRMQRTRSFTDALREKYCNQENDNQCDFIISIMVRHKPRKDEDSAAELAHLRNVVLNNRRVSTGGLPPSGLTSLCPNVCDLDLSSNLLENWAELLPILSQLPNLTFLNLSRNHLTRHKEELWRWTTPLPRIENVVLNSTGIPLREVLALAHHMPALRELHICCNYYRDLGSVELAIQDGALSKLECLRLNENIITSWAEVWKLRNLPRLTQLILSENPLCDVFYNPSWQPRDDLDVDSPNITCHSDGEDSLYGSPCFQFSSQWGRADAHQPLCNTNLNSSLNEEVRSYAHVIRMTPAADCQSINNNSRRDFVLDNGVRPSYTTVGKGHHEQNTADGKAAGRWLPRGDKEECAADHCAKPASSNSAPCTRSNVVSELIKDLVSNALQRISIQESSRHCGQVVQDAHRDSSDGCTGFVSRCGGGDSFEADKQNIGTPSAPGTPVKTSSTGVKNLTSTPVKTLRDASLDTSRADFDLELDPQLAQDGDEMSMDMGIVEDLENSNDLENSINTSAVADETERPFAKLHTLCLSRTSLSEMDHLHALNDFPQLRSLKIMDTGFFPDVAKDDKRKLFIASLLQVKMLNGSEVTSTERDKAERFYLRHFMDHDVRPARYYDLESKHGPVTPLLDIDLGKKFQKEATLTFFLNGEEVFTDTVCVLQPVGKLRSLVAQTLAVPRRSFRMFHFACGPEQSANEGAFDELCLESLPMSRFDFMDGDEIHVEFIDETNANAVVHFSKKEIKF